MSTFKSSGNNCLWSMNCCCEGQNEMINNYMNDMDYYLFGDNNIPTSELVKRVLSRTFLDDNFVSIVKNQLDLMHLIDSVNDLGASARRSVDGDDILDFIDITMNDPVILSDILVASIPFDEEDNDYGCVEYDYSSDPYENDGNFIEDTMMDLMDGVIYDNGSSFLWADLDEDDIH